jgi:alkylation response protein AidB-like acyl-CoA dehydrogenase
MDFNFNQEQLQFADALKRWIGRDYTFEARRAIIHSDRGSSDAAWATLAELGMTALPVPEEHGGFNGNAVDMFVVMQELGRGLVVEPYFATVLGAEFLRLAGGRGELLEQVASGELKLACALGERQSRHDMFDIATRATANGDGWVLNGEKKVVIHGAESRMLVVSARSGGEQRGQDGVSLFVLPADTPGITVTGYRTLDGQRAADVRFENVQAPRSSLLGEAGQGAAILDAALDYGTGLLCAEALGAMEAIFEATLEYLKTRQQFGAPIGKFQALQHRMADMYIHLEQARSMALMAAVKLASNDAEGAHARRRAVSAAKYRINLAARFVGQQAVQLHGGMGVTDELPAAHYFKRLATIELTLGDADHHLARFIAQPGFADKVAA